jgi:carbonic anhydrase
MSVRCLFVDYLLSFYSAGTAFVDDSNFVLRNILPANYDNYFMYNGSLTTPNCNEIVTWIILSKTETISHDDVHILIIYFIYLFIIAVNNVTSN